MARNWDSEDQTQIVRIENVAADAVTCSFMSGGTFKISYQFSEFSSPPRVGEVWLVGKIQPNVWKLWNRVHVDKTNVMRYGIRLDCSECLGKERAIVEDIAAAGFEEVYLTIAKDSVVYWDSDIANDYGLLSLPILRQLLDRFRNKRIDVTCVLSCEMWSDTTSEKQHEYQQKSLSGEYSRMASPSAAKEAVSSLLEELYGKYGADIYGYCLDGVGLAGYEFDRNEQADKNFYSAYHVMPPEEYLANGVDEEFLLWRQFLSEEQASLCQGAKEALHQKPLIGIVPDYSFCIVDSEGVGSGRSGVADNFGSYGWDYVGFPLRYQQNVDKEAELRSLESLVAINTRFGEGSKPIYILDIPTLTQPYGVFEILSKYDASMVVVGDYHDYKLLSDESCIQLWGAMDKYRITEKNSSDYNGMVLSTASLQASHWGDAASIDYMKSYYSMSSLMIDKTSNRMRVMFDKDLETTGRFNDNAATCLFMVSNLSDTAIENIQDSLELSGRFICMVGRCGYYRDTAKVLRDYPFLDYFGDSADSDREYIYSLTINGGVISDFKRSFAIDLGTTGIKSVKGAGVAFGYDQVQTDDGVMNIEVNAPVFVRDRHVYFAIDPVGESLLLEPASEFFVFSMSRVS